MNERVLDKKAFEAIHDLKNDAVRLSRHVDRLEAITSVDAPDREVVITDFLSEYEAFLAKYENSANDKIKAFVVEVKSIITSNKAELAGVGLEVSGEGSLTIFDANFLVKDTSREEGESVFAILNEALLNAEVHMERFIPEKYLSYDRQRDYRILKQEGNIYTKEI